ncbi:HAD family hydrolase [Actinobacillus succinogenes]|uniref:HAD-superfamily hydrolase, subfamily IA, variant 3 n=1 Tax=Actinobacillus succinogenes (strain ATCC 55618 / DSM 22257 / CCUG 43843 / 130Z) TaxID=339671 RepID=A6VLZ3_ACTSZ|nr:HAD-IA family hydrolase [Actinobacillus succinogenes]ABR73990.1 HAD-superfamily hydrolase, subfamily IA, variant 3 [Actinobacillus succinogenes 130Z]PHI39569.1 HAD family hydrolase [Actinobacillus succinogenes]
MAIKNVIFDMDGVLVDSEPLWAESQIEILAQYGAVITEPDCEKYTRGLRVDELAAVWVKKFHLNVEPTLLRDKIVELVCRKITEKSVPMDGIYQLLDFLKSKQIPTALATSSNRKVIKTVFDKLKLWDYFPIQCTAADEELAKPHPAVYLSAVKALGATAGDCLIIEDSVTGLIAAKAANVRTFIVNPKFADERFAIADERMASLRDVLNILQQEL